MTRIAVGMMAFALALSATVGHAAEDCSLVKVSEIALSFDAWGRPMVPVSLNGQERYFVIDTGGVYNTLQRAPADALGLRSRRGRIGLTGVTGETSDQVVTVREVQMGNLHAADWLFVIQPGDPGMDSEIRSVGTIAPDTLALYDLDFDFGSNVMNLFRQDHCEGQVAYWRPQVIAVVPFELDRTKHITIPVTLDGVELTAMLDTGAADSTLNRVVAERELGLDFSSEDAERLGTLGDGGDQVYRRKFQRLSLEGVEIQDPTLTVLPDLMSRGLGRLFGVTRLPDVIVGMSVLSHFHIYIAYGEKKLYITEVGT